MQIQAAREANDKREKEAVEAGKSVLINIVDPEDVSHPYRAFSKTWESFQSQFGNMIQKNEHLENEIFKYKKRAEILQAKIDAIEKAGGAKIVTNSSKKEDFKMEDSGEDY